MASRNTITFSLLAVMGAAGSLLFLAARGLTGSTAGGQSLVPALPDPNRPSAEELLKRRGAYLMASIGCNDCHSAHDSAGRLVPGLELAGHPEAAPSPTWDPSMLEKGNLASIGVTMTAFAGPWGTSYAPNLTPDKETGIGTMTAEQLIESWRSGKHWKEKRPVLPPMPIQAFAALTDEDIRALYAYLMSRPPVRNRVPASIVAPPPPPSAAGPAGAPPAHG